MACFFGFLGDLGAGVETWCGAGVEAGTLHVVTLTLRIPMYSGCRRKSLVVMLVAAVLAACSNVDRRMSQVA